MKYDHDAIYKAYAGIVVSINDDLGAFDKDGKSVSIDDSLVTKARTELDEEAAKVKYKTDRSQNPNNPNSSGTYYADWREQLAMLYDDIVAGKVDATGSFAAHNKAVKDANPKP
tara:strand:- start:7 stop:348 length:342 start_codon:yes stop_codon:yes gene_type:complete